MNGRVGVSAPSPPKAETVYWTYVYINNVRTPAFSAIFLEVILSPIASMLYSVGPRKTAPASSTAREKSLFSDRKP